MGHSSVKSTFTKGDRQTLLIIDIIVCRAAPGFAGSANNIYLI